MNRKRILALVLSLLMLPLAGCSLFGGNEDQSVSENEQPSDEEVIPEYPVEAAGITLPARPGRVVSLAPALTEKLFDLGMADRLAGVSDYCDYPEAVLPLARCGTAQIPDVQVIEKLNPNLVVSEAALPDEAMAALEAAGIPVAVLLHPESVDGLADSYIALARLMEGETSGAMIGESVADEFRDGLDELHGTLSAYTAENGRKTALYLKDLDFYVATGDTFENELLDMLCLDNIAAGYSGREYPAGDAKSAEGQAAFAGVDIIFMDKDYVTIKDLEQSDFYRGLPATIQDRYLYISSIEMERQSLRTLDLLAEMAQYAYPEAGAHGFGYRERDADEIEIADEASGDDEETLDEGRKMLDAVDDMY